MVFFFFESSSTKSPEVRRGMKIQKPFAKGSLMTAKRNGTACLGISITRLFMITCLMTAVGCIDGRLTSRRTNEAKEAIHFHEGPARNQSVRNARLAEIDQDLKSGLITNGEYERRKANLLNEYWQRENTRRHRSTTTIHGSSRDRLE